MPAPSTPLPDDRLLAALRGHQDIDAICAASGVTRAEFLAARATLLARRLPPANARLNAAVSGPVEIARDRNGIPRIAAGTTSDLYFGLGFAMTQDRLWQMDRLRRRALGRQAEVMGSTYLTSDLAHRLVGIPEITLAGVERTDPATRAILEPFVAGINRGIEAFGVDLPIEFALLNYQPEPFTVRDVIAILRGIWWSLNGRLETIVIAEAARLVPEPFRSDYLTPECPGVRIVPDHGLAPELLAAGPPRGSLPGGEGDNLGSNNWAVAGAKTGTGHALLCTDPHQPFWLPTSWYEYILDGPEDRVAGAGHPGVPGLWWGSNGDLAWGLTNNTATTRDLYIEQIDPHDPSRYLDGDTWRQFTEDNVAIAVAGEAPRAFVRRSTVRGPLMNAVLPPVDPAGDPPLSLRWVGQEHLDDIRALIRIGRARDPESFRDALRDWSVAVFNFGWADRQGRVGYQCAGRIPLRGRVATGYRDAQHPADRWTGYIPFDELPRWLDPEQGYVASANNRPTGDAYPHPLIGAWAAGWRQLRIDSVIRPTTRFTPADGRALLLDTVSLRAATLAPAIAALLATTTDPGARLLGDTLADWPGDYSLESLAPVLFETFMAFWQERIAAQWLPPHLVATARARGRIAERSLIEPGYSPLDGDLPALVAETATRAVAAIRGRHGDDPAGWRWGRVHLVHLRHPLSTPSTADCFDLGPAPIPGSFETLFNTGLGTPPGCESVSGVEYRLIADFAHPHEILAIQNAGNSGQPGSPHYADQFQPWIDGDFHRLSLTEPLAIVGKTTLEPDR